MTLEDETGMANLVIWARTWAAHRKLARTATMLGVDGRLQRQDDALSVLVDTFWEVPEPDPDPEAATSLPAAVAAAPLARLPLTRPCPGRRPQVQRDAGTAVG
ncbi:MAG: hypothetical protein R3F59_04335 [Myxococcota bacterium]